MGILDLQVVWDVVGCLMIDDYTTGLLSFVLVAFLTFKGLER